MTRDNHLLGKFDISGVLPVPRGVPQIDNQLGVGQPSSRLVFRTTSLREEELEVVEGERPSPAQCCQTAGVSSDCQPLCTFDLDTASLANLTAVCSQQLDRVVRCGAGGRDHLQCCRRRAVPTASLSGRTPGPHWGGLSPVPTSRPDHLHLLRGGNSQSPASRQGLSSLPGWRTPR